MADDSPTGRRHLVYPPADAPASDPRVTPLAVGSVVFAACVLFLVGFFHAIVGLAVLIDEDMLSPPDSYLFAWGTHGWGWLHLGFGVAAVTAAVNLFSARPSARVIGIVVALLSVVKNFFFAPYSGVWSAIMVGMNVLVIWALTRYGPEQAQKVYGAPTPRTQ
ncbi:hypothetical protein GCM10010129_06430 [Streptomyces fumigatiscleroticus]|nr:hypothetical protein GCM10010129_06430 [Streptomyces fumigatiscleroticus]